MSTRKRCRLSLFDLGVEFIVVYRQLASLKYLCLWLAVLLLLALVGCRQGETSTLESDGGKLIQNKGSDTIVNLALAWAERYQQVKPEVEIAVTGGGSGTGLAALVNNTVDIANASRAIKPEELENARANGVEPQEFVIARDAIAIVVHPSNPVDRLTLQQLSDIFSGKVDNWQQVGGEDRPIVRLSRETNSGTHVYFLETVVRLGDKDDTTLFSPDTLLLPSSEGIGAEIRQNPNAIGYDGLGYVTEDMKTLEVRADPDGPFWAPSIMNVNDGVYPVSRNLYMYTDGNPNETIETYLDWIRSPEAQMIVRELGFVPLVDVE
jgi:phosphate transport system substrate-binding protein